MSLLEFRCRLRYPAGFELDAAFTADAPVTALVGRSGCGKTTVLSLIAGLRRPDAGRIALGGRVLVDVDGRTCLPPESRRIGYVFQDHLLFPHLSVRDNLLYGWRRRPAGASAPTIDRVVDVLELGEFLDRWPQSLSGGQRQRVALGRALLAGPELLLLDEPLASIEEELRDRVLSYLQAALAEWRVPALYVTHHRAEALRIAGAAVELEQGKVRRAGAAADVLLGDGAARPENSDSG